MKPLKLFLLLLLCLACACQDDLLTDADSQPTWQLPEGEDSFSLGTLFVGHATPPQKLMLRNPHRGELALSSIVLRGGAESPFCINVDGMAGHAFTNGKLLHIASGDSLCILVAARYEGPQTERRMELEDYIDVTCNGRQQSIRLRVTACDAEEVHRLTIDHDTQWDATGLDKLVSDTLWIAPDATLTIGAGVTLYLHDRAHIMVGGTLRLMGTAEAPVVLQGDRTDRIFPNLYYVDMSAQWDGITLDSTSHHNRFEHAHIKGMDSGIVMRQRSTDLAFMASARDDVDATDPKRYSYGPEFLDDDEHLQATFRHCQLRNSNAPLITAYNSNAIIENCELLNGGRGLVHLYGGAYDITHCTLANYCYWQTCDQYDLIIANWQEGNDEQVFPMWRCNLTNSIVYGRWNRQQNVGIYFSRYRIEGYDSDSLLHYRMVNSLIYAPTATLDDDLREMLFDADPEYQLIDIANYLIDPRLQPTSPAAATGSPRAVSRLPLDLDGKPRDPLAPSMGCYEAQKETTDN